MIGLLRSLFAPILSLILVILGCGLFNTFVSVRLALEGFSNESIGIVASAYYMGSLYGAVRSPAWIHRFNHLRTLVILCVLSGAAILMQAFWVNLTFWAVIRFLSGIGMGGLFVVIESWFLLASSPTIRSQALSVYLIVLYGSLSASQLLLNFMDPFSLIPFCIAVLLTLVAILPVTLRPIQVPAHEKTERFSFLTIFRASPRGFFGGIISGVVLACVHGLAPVYGQEMGMTVPAIGTFMAMIIFGGLSLQMPMGKMADRKGRRSVLVLACFATALFSSLIAFCDGTSWSLLLVFSWLFGGFAFVLYPLSMAFTCEGICEHQIVSATGGFVLSYGIGAIVGPIAAPLFMSWLGSGGLFYFISAMALLLGTIGILPDLSVAKRDPKIGD